jgi:hypothetical protein
VSEWQPIDTAPKDGDRILIFGKWDGVVSARWIGEPHNIWLIEPGSVARDPTHWMPLPEPPNTHT